MRIYKLVSRLVAITACQWKSVYWQPDSSHLENLLKYIFEIGVNKNFDLRWVRKFFWDLSNVISGANWFFKWDCAFPSGTVLLCELWGLLFYFSDLAVKYVNLTLWLKVYHSVEWDISLPLSETPLTSFLSSSIP